MGADIVWDEAVWETGTKIRTRVTLGCMSFFWVGCFFFLGVSLCGGVSFCGVGCCGESKKAQA